jgi:O-antigen ligase
VFGGRYTGVAKIIALGCISIIAIIVFVIKYKALIALSSALVILYMQALLFIGSRQILGAVGIALIVFAVTGVWKVRGIRISIDRSVKRALLIMLLVSLYISVVTMAGFETQTLKRFSAIFDYSEMSRSNGEGVNGDTEESSGHRFMPLNLGIRGEFYINSIRFWSANPVFGNGIGSWPIMQGMGDITYYPHNIVLEILAELGIVGLILFFAIGIYAVFISQPVSTLHTIDVRRTILAILAFALFISMLSMDIKDNRLLWAFTALSLCGGEKEKNSR